MTDEHRQKLADIAEKYGNALAAMSNRELVDELEKQALMASYGYQSPATATMLKTAKGEILSRLKGQGSQKPAAEEPESKQKAQRPTLFG